MSKAPKVLGILSIVFGGLCAAWAPLGLMMKSFMNGVGQMANTLPHTPGMRDPQLDFGAARAMLDAQWPYVVGSSIMYFTMSIALVIVGAGLLKRKQWGRKLAIGWSALALVIIVVQFALMTFYLIPVQDAARNAFYAAHNAGPPPFDAQKAGQAGGVFGLLFYAAYPIVLWAMLGKRQMEAEFTA
jgi:hypothetical protein